MFIINLPYFKKLSRFFNLGSEKNIDLLNFLLVSKDVSSLPLFSFIFTTKTLKTFFLSGLEYRAIALLADDGVGFIIVGKIIQIFFRAIARGDIGSHIFFMDFKPILG